MFSRPISFRKGRRASSLCCAFLAVFLSSARAIEPDAAQPDPSRLHILLKEHDIAIGKTPIDWQRLSDFYRRRDMQLAWVGSDADRDLALRALEDAPQEGL